MLDRFASRDLVFYYTNEWFFSSVGAVAFLPPNLDKAVLKRRVEFTAGRICAQQALLQLGIEQENCRVGVGVFYEPLWPQQTVGSISHTNQFARAVVGSAREFRGMGIDVEEWMAPTRAQNLAATFATPAELSALMSGMADALGKVDTACLVTLIFSAKESLYKCVFPRVRRILSFYDVYLTAIDWQTKTIQAQWNEYLPGLPQVCTFSMQEGIVSTECLWI